LLRLSHVECCVSSVSMLTFKNLAKKVKISAGKPHKSRSVPDFQTNFIATDLSFPLSFHIPLCTVHVKPRPRTP
jgi:hypothetical protein